MLDGQEVLTQHLQKWADSERVRLNWVKGTLRLEMRDSTAGAVVSFPEEFWYFFALADAMTQQTALESIALSVAVEYRPPAAQFAHDIQIPLNLVKAE